MKKFSIWSKVAKLSEDDLSKTAEKVEVLPPEKREKKIEKRPEKKIEKKIEPIKQKEEKIKKKEEAVPEEWLPGGITGQLSVDLYDAGDSLILKSTVAGITPQEIDITVEQDLITIKGERKHEEKIERKNYFYQECFWGKFSRTLVLPLPIKPEGVRANIKNGILTIVLPKAEEKKKNIEVE